VAWNRELTHIVAHGESLEEAHRAAVDAAQCDVVFEHVGPPTLFLGGPRRQTLSDSEIHPEVKMLLKDAHVRKGTKIVKKKSGYELINVSTTTDH
jgi:hypothetical protein